MLDVDFFRFFTNFLSPEWVQSGLDLSIAARQWIFEKYHTAPALVFGIAVAVFLPAVAVTGPILRFVFRRFRKRARTDLAANYLLNDQEAVPRTRPASAWRQDAWLEFQNSKTAHYPVARSIIRIGREADNDLCLADPTVHRYHAILEQTPEAEYFVSYIGDPDREGMFINGRPADRQRLRGGEVLEIGAIKLRFALRTA